MLVGNKADLSETRQVTFEQGQELAERNHMRFFETSAKTGQQVDDVFLSLALQTIEKNPEIVKSAGGKMLKRSGSEKDGTQSGCCS